MTIRQILEKIQNERYGETVRQAIIDGIQLCYDERALGGYNPVEDLNDFYNGSALFTSSVANAPIQSSFIVMSAGTDTNCCQVAIDATNLNNSYLRKKQSNSWSAWMLIGTSKKLRYWNYNGSELLHTESVSSGHDGIWNGAPTKDPTQQYEYTFLGWSTSKNASAAEETATKNITADRDVYAAYRQSVRNYTVYFYNGSTLLGNVSVPYGSNASDATIERPSKASTPQYEYTFVGWNSQDKQETAEANALNNIVADKNAYAAFSKQIRSYTVSFYIYRGSQLLGTDTVPYGSNASDSGIVVPAKTSTAQYRYVFDGWNSNSGQTAAEEGVLNNITGNKSVYAAYKPVVRTYTVRFMNGTTVLQTVNDVPYGGDATYTGSTPQHPTEPDEYTFIGFDPDGTAITGNTDCRAVYILNPKKLRYWNYDGTQLLYTETVEHGGDGSWNGTSSKPSTTEHSYIFLGWNTSKNASVADDNATKNLTADRDVYAAFQETVRSYSVHFYNGTTLLYTDLVQYGDSASYTGAAPTKASSQQYDYHFEGWNSQDEQSAAEAGVLDNIVDDKDVYAAYSSTFRQYTVTFMNGSVTLGTVTVDYGTAASDATITTPTKAQTAQYTYTFAGWNSQDEQSAAETGVLNNITADKTVYAAFSATVREYTVTFMNGATLLTTATVPYGSNASYSGDNPTKAQTAQYRYSFIGWNSQDEQYEAEANILNNITADKTVYAAYSRTVRQYYVIFKNGANVVLGSELVNYGRNATGSSISTPTKEPTPYYEYTFVGWNSQDEQTEAEAGVLNNITAEKTVYAAYAAVDRRKTVYFYNGATLLTSVIVPYGGTAVYEGNDPTKDPSAQYTYTFAGWNSQDEQTTEESGVLENITANKNVYAAFSTTTREYSVYFYNGSTLLETATVQYGGTAVYPGSSNPTKAATAQYTYTFAGWNSQDEQTEAEAGVLENITGDKTVYAAFVQATRTYTVTFKNGSTTLQTDTVSYGGTASYVVPQPTKESTIEYDYTFVGWNSQDGQQSAESGILNNITADKTVYAAFSQAWSGVLYQNGVSYHGFGNSWSGNGGTNNANGLTLYQKAQPTGYSRHTYTSSSSFNFSDYSTITLTYSVTGVNSGGGFGINGEFRLVPTDDSGAQSVVNNAGPVDMGTRTYNIPSRAKKACQMQLSIYHHSSGDRSIRVTRIQVNR